MPVDGRLARSQFMRGTEVFAQEFSLTCLIGKLCPLCCRYTSIIKCSGTNLLTAWAPAESIMMLGSHKSIAFHTLLLAVNSIFGMLETECRVKQPLARRIGEMLGNATTLNYIDSR